MTAIIRKHANNIDKEMTVVAQEFKISFVLDTVFKNGLIHFSRSEK